MIKEKKPKAPSMAQLDKAWSKAILDRDKHTCQVCKKVPHPKGLGAHHIIPRQHLLLRHNLSNGIALCYGCHKVGKNAAHQNALFFHHWMQYNRQEQYNYLMDHIRIEVNKYESKQS